MKSAAEIAIDQAGYSLSPTLERIALPPDSQLTGSLQGDLQSLDSKDERIFYYLRTTVDEAVPKWIANLARASHAMEAGQVYLVVSQYTENLVTSCVENGAGLLRLTGDSVFEVIVDYTQTSPRSLQESIRVRIDELRRSLERKVETNRTGIRARVGASTSILGRMEGDAADEYTDVFDAEYRNLDSWGEEMSRRLDALGERSRTGDIADVEALIEAGPPDARPGH